MAQAQAALRRLQTQREENTLPVLKRTPKFSECVKQYLNYYQIVKDAVRMDSARDVPGTAPVCRM